MTPPPPRRPSRPIPSSPVNLGTGTAGERFLQYAKIDEAHALKTMQDLRYGCVIFCTREKREAYEAGQAKKAAFEEEQRQRAEAQAANTGAASAEPGAGGGSGEAAVVSPPPQAPSSRQEEAAAA